MLRFKINQTVNGGFYVLVHIENGIRVQQVFVSPLVSKFIKRNPFFLPHAPNQEFFFNLWSERSYASDFVKAGFAAAFP